MAGAALEHPDPDLLQSIEQSNRLLRGGSWFNDPRDVRAAFRNGDVPVTPGADVGLRPCCPSPPGSLLGP